MAGGPARGQAAAWPLAACVGAPSCQQHAFPTGLPVPSPACSVHPNVHGMLALSELMLAPLQRALEEEAAGLHPARRDEPRLDPFPPPMIPNSPYERTQSICAVQARAAARLPAGQWHGPRLPPTAGTAPAADE